MPFPSNPLISKPARPNFLRRLPWRKLFARAVFTLLALIALAAIIYNVDNWRGRRAWAAYRAGAAARGASFTLANYVSPPIPEEENFAMALIFQNACKRQAGEKVERPSMNAWLEPLPGREADVQAVNGLANRWKGPGLDLKVWQNYLLACGHLEKAGENPASDVLLALSKADLEINDLRKAAKRPGCRFPVRWEDSHKMMQSHLNEIQPHLGEIIFTAKYLRVRIAAELALGQNDNALADMRLLFRLEKALEKEPTFICALMRLTANNLLHVPVFDGCAQQQWRESDLREIQATLSKTNLLEAYHFACSSERAIINDLEDALMSMGGDERLKIVKVTADARKTMENLKLIAPSPPDPFPAFLHKLAPTGLSCFNKVKLYEYMDARMAGMKAINHGRQADSSAPAIKVSAERGAFNRFYYAPFLRSVPTWEKMDKDFLFAHSRQQFAIITCALERWRLGRGSIPEKLADMVPEFLAQVSNDVMDGQPMRYQPDGAGGYRLWSAGINAIDEQGLQTPGKQLPDQPDWLWTMPGR